MPSPIKQAELQLKLLKQYLCDNTEKVIGKFLGMQQGMGMRCYDVFCAISSDAIIDRSKAPTDIADKLVKSEFVTDALDKKMHFIKFFNLAAKIADTRPTFNQEELSHICQFLLGNTSQLEADSVNETPAAWPAPMQIMPVADTAVVTPPVGTNKSVSSAVKAQIKSAAIGAITAQCKHCGDYSALSPQSGRYGYYMQCGKCGGNTPLKRPCPACKSQNIKVSKAKAVYRLVCSDCLATATVTFSSD